MADTQPLFTDPARELADLCTRLIGGGNASGDQYLASQFGVPVWSYDFHRIIGAIIVRIEFVKKIVGDLDLDPDFRDEMVAHIETIRSVFGGDSFRHNWSSFGGTRLVPEHIQPLKALSGQVRTKIGYKRLTEEEQAEVHNDATTLRDWLVEANLRENDFVRGLLIEALDDFIFRMAHLRWVGVAYTVDGLREVIAAYLLLERGGIDPKIDPIAEATVKKVTSFVKGVWAKVQTGREVYDTADWALRVYGAVSAIQHVPVVTALLN